MPQYPNGSTTQPRVSSPFGPRTGGAFSFHYGADLVGFATIHAAIGGKVTFAGWMNGAAGYTVVIDIGGGVSILYMHLASVAVTRGQSVDEGHKLGVMGKSGNATGICLHFEVRVKGTSVEPLAWLRNRIAAAQPASTPTSNPVNPEEYPEMFYAVIKNQAWFLIVPQGTNKPRAVVLGANAVGGAPLPVIQFDWDPSIAALKAAVEGI